MIIPVDNVLDLIGNTPLIKINKLNRNNNVEIFAKLESYNPGGSIKDRVALNMIKDAIDKQILTKDKIILEPTSGNTGTGLAMISALLGYEAILVMNETVSQEKINTIKAYGSSVILTKKELGGDGPIDKVNELIKKYPHKYVFLNQYSNPKNYEAHYKTAEEIWNQMDGDIDYLVAGIGTSGTLMGISKYLKQKNPNIKIIAVHPTSKIDGLKDYKNSEIPDIYDNLFIDDIINLNRENAIKTTRQIIIKEGIFAGISSGGALNIGLKLANKIDNGRIVVIFPDGFEKYLSENII